MKQINTSPSACLNPLIFNSISKLTVQLPKQVINPSSLKTPATMLILYPSWEMTRPPGALPPESAKRPPVVPAAPLHVGGFSCLFRSCSVGGSSAIRSHDYFECNNIYQHFSLSRNKANSVLCTTGNKQTKRMKQNKVVLQNNLLSISCFR